VTFETKDSMGANFINSCLEQLAKKLKEEAQNYSDFNETEKSVLIGYTFFARSCWGRGINHAVKHLMLDYAFQFVDKVIFHVGANNIRSQKAMERVGAVNLGLEEVAYYGEATRTNIVYAIFRDARSI
jgi:RimJ/RimL family protein N-acetyltransferase